MHKALTSRGFSEHTVALSAAVALHALVVVCLVPAMAKPIAFRQQAIQIHMVAPSSFAQRQVQPQPESQIVQAAPPKEDAVKLQQKIQKKVLPEKKIEPLQQAASSVPTSGRQAEDATAKAAASTEPVFDAAYLQNPPPVYPPAARRQGVQGKVILEVDVTPQGNARHVEVERSSGSSLLDSAALDAVSQWRFVPAQRGEQVVAAEVLVPVEFKLN